MAVYIVEIIQSRSKYSIFLHLVHSTKTSLYIYLLTKKSL